jgi:hypothetical protein
VVNGTATKRRRSLGSLRPEIIPQGNGEDFALRRSERREGQEGMRVLTSKHSPSFVCFVCFVGGCFQCLWWVPPRPERRGLLAVAIPILERRGLLAVVNGTATEHRRSVGSLRPERRGSLAVAIPILERRGSLAVVNGTATKRRRSVGSLRPERRGRSIAASVLSRSSQRQWPGLAKPWIAECLEVVSEGVGDG